ncbi:bifunctional folylpolyglutamate synthase/dihydrofolate synthase [Gryllotalpicola protaetiae]|uniref:tetrahydrofolate synthase n=1 Tax=Gryllotalpicola protaetiae TaxID=2419771 RepID=A0A387C3J1_9MICO|nr:folylpolyglutamate synthase/dihydrofolate synthase family protein [Gryllotalpicola protaetiae]AYG05131.1 bifunctional folylpolyglutamate synthase/dihydrofolate synthase [Gryllotalpicola protaetiae]
MSDDSHRAAADAAYGELLTRVGEAKPERRLDATRRAVEVLGDPQKAYPIIHITGTNGKTSTSRIAESILRAYGLRTGLLTSPHLERFNERILIDGQPIADEALARNWDEIRPYLELVDAELEASGRPRLTFFEAVTALGFACFADAPVDVAVVEVGMGGEWDSTNVGDGTVAVFTPISLDHQAALGSTIAEIARTKAGIIKDGATVVTARQTPEAMREIQAAASRHGASVIAQPSEFDVTATSVAVGGQLVDVRGVAGAYDGLTLPLYGDHQAQNAAVAIAAVEAFIGGGAHALTHELVEEGIAAASSPGRLQLIGTEPTVIVDAAHNPAGAATLRAALDRFFDFDEVAVVLGILKDKDAHGIIDELAQAASLLIVTQSHSERARPAEDLAEDIYEWTQEHVEEVDDLGEAIEAARAWALKGEKRAVVVTGSITLVGEAMTLAEQRGWRSARTDELE